MVRHAKEERAASRKLAGTLPPARRASPSAPINCSSSSNHSFATAVTPLLGTAVGAAGGVAAASLAEQVADGPGLAQPLQAAGTAGSDAADRHLQLLADLGVADGRLGHQQRQQPPAARRQ